MDYILVVNGKPEGPYSIEELKSRKIKAGDFVRSAEMDDYKEAHEVAELRLHLGFSKQAHTPQYFGSFDQRLLASVLDWFLISLFIVPAATIIIWFTPDKMMRSVITFSLLLIIPLVKFIYHIIMESSVKQATIGKQLLKIKVCDMQGERISPGRSAGRNFAKVLSVLTLFIGYLFAFFNRHQQCLHDMIAGTLVMKDRLI